MIQLSNDLNKGNTTASQVIKEELPFDVYAYEKIGRASCRERV